MSQSITKPGQYGTLTLFEVFYSDPIDSGFGRRSVKLWGYNRDHVIDKFFDDPMAEGFQVIEVLYAIPVGSVDRRKHAVN